MCFWKTLYWRLLSNYGDALKFMLPMWRYKSGGGFNRSDKVTMHKISENEIGDHVSKSIINGSFSTPAYLKFIIVKEQRVDGNRCRLFLTCQRRVLCVTPHILHLRCILMGLERDWGVVKEEAPLYFNNGWNNQV